MSYEIMSAFSFSKDFRSVKGSSACNNVQPRTQYPFTHEAKEDVATLDYVKSWVKDIIGGSLQFQNKNHKINVIVQLSLRKHRKEDVRSFWVSQFDFKSFTYGKGFSDKEEEKEYHAFKEEENNFYEFIALGIMNDTFKDEIKNLKKEEYILTNYDSFITKYTKKGFRSCHKIEYAKVINGIELMFLPNYIKEQYSYIPIKKEEIKNRFIEHAKILFDKRFDETSSLFPDLKSKVTKEQFIKEKTEIRLSSLGM